MKRLFRIFIILSVILFGSINIVSCKKDKGVVADKHLTEAVQGLTFPQTLNDGTKLTNCYYKEKVLTFRCELDKDKLSKMDVEQYRANTLERLKTGLFPRNLIKNVTDAGASIRYIYVNENDSVMFSFTSDELKLQ